MSEDQVRKEFAVQLENGDVFSDGPPSYSDTPEGAFEHDLPRVRALGERVGVKFGELRIVEREVRLTYSPWVESDWRPADD